MSKKKNKKFRKNKLLAKTSTVQEIKAPEVGVQSSVTKTYADTSIDAEKGALDPYKNKEYDHVKKDTKKIVLILACLAVIFIGIHFLGVKTNVLTAFGNWIFRISNIQSQ